MEGDWPCISTALTGGAKVVVEQSGLKPYWGKPAVRNFRGGGGNVRMVWSLFTTPPERADTSEADRPNLGAPSLHSVALKFSQPGADRASDALSHPGLGHLVDAQPVDGRGAAVRARDAVVGFAAVAAYAQALRPDPGGAGGSGGNLSGTSPGN